MNIFKVTKKNYKSLPQIEYGKEYDFDSLLLIPNGEIHNSGYSEIDIIGCIKNEAVYNCGKHCDLLCFDGIGGYGYNLAKTGKCVAYTVEPNSWRIDMTPKGFVRIFVNKMRKIRVPAHNTEFFEFYEVKNKNNDDGLWFERNKNES